jgi:cell division protein FtsL
VRTAIARPHGKGRLQLNARLVREKDRARLRELRRLALYGAAIVVPLLVYVWQRVDFIRTSYSLEAINHEQQQLQELNKQYTLERSSLLAPDRIEKVARQQLGLSEPTPEDVRRVQVIDGRVNEIGVTLASLPPPASRPVTEPGAYLSASILPALPLPEKREEPPR